MRALLLPLLLLTSAALAAGEQARPDQKIRVLLDTDANNELDDQHAIAYMLFSGDRFDVEGITVNRTKGGGDIHAQHAEAIRVVKLSGMYGRIPVLKGADGSFTEIAPHVNDASFDGSEAVRFIIEKAHEPGSGPLVLLPVGKLTNIALALKKDPSIATKVRIVWLGSNFPEPGEYNQENDEPSLQYVLDSEVPFEIALVRYGKPSGTDAVRVTPAENRKRIAGKGPRAAEPVTGRHGGEFRTFGDYSIELFEHIDLHGDPPSRALFDMAAVAIVKNPSWARPRRIPAPRLADGKWVERPDNPRTITIWEDFDRERILADFYRVMDSPQLATPSETPARRLRLAAYTHLAAGPNGASAVVRDPRPAATSARLRSPGPRSCPGWSARASHSLRGSRRLRPRASWSPTCHPDT